MRKYFVLFSILSLALQSCSIVNKPFVFTARVNTNDEVRSYIKTYAPIAQDEMREFGIPASITLAQGILESGAGKSTLARKSNNHFGIKCHTGWEGKSVLHDDDAKDECFRVYDSPRESYRDHSLFLTQRNRYSFLFNYRPRDYKAWAKGLKKAGYATDRKYARRLVAYIKAYDLKSYDKIRYRKKEQALVYQYPQKQTVTAQNKEQKPLISKNKKNRQTHLVSKGETLYYLSKLYGVPIKDLKKWNQLKNNSIKTGQELIIAK